MHKTLKTSSGVGMNELTRIHREVPKTIEGLRDALFDEINLIRSGNGNIARAHAMAKIADKILESLKMQINSAVTLEELQKSAPILIGSDKNGT